MKNRTVLILFLLIQNSLFSQHSEVPEKGNFSRDHRFTQEFQESYPVSEAKEGIHVRSVAVDKASTLYIATENGVYFKLPDQSTWSPLLFPESEKGPAYAVYIDQKGTLWIGSWNGLFHYMNGTLYKIPGGKGPISVLCGAQEGIYALGPQGIWLMLSDRLIPKNYPVARSVRTAISDNNGGLWIGSDVGLYHSSEKGTTHLYKTDKLLSAALKGVSLDNQGRIWAAGLGGISILKNGLKDHSLQPKDGCPSIFVNCVKKSPEGVMWVGTKTGVVRYFQDGSHSLLFSRRWLLDDQVNDICFDQDGTAWIATEKGVSAIRKKWMTLQSKQDYFYDVLMRRHIRAPWIAGQCYLPIPGDTTRWMPEDDDNDGEYTGNYLAMESFRYAATHSPDAREKAKKAYHFLQQLQEITGGDGYFARSIVPVDWKDRVHDPNHTYTVQELAENLVEEPRFKPVETRWHPSADGKWLWKGDASSDEWCGHMMGYFFYYQLAADSSERQLIRRHVSLLLDHLIDHGFNMMDVDGTHTRWSVWSPALLNRDPEWNPDRAQNSMELLAYLKFGYYITGNEKYQLHYLHLIQNEHYLDNMKAILEQNPAWFIYYDVSLQVYLFPILIRCEKDPKLRSFYEQFFDRWMQRRLKDQNPQINFLYCYARNKKIALNASLNFLINTPLDLVDWNIDHTKREDVHIIHEPVLDEKQLSELPSPSIRSTVRWDNNPFGAIGGVPTNEKEPVFWLYPYWLGRYLKMIQ